ncbi:1-acyl-sn-glycerol-3-phosphate acyltransferase, partial [Acidithiobacillus thiooxidans]|uniref:1-acyl-sn-glycerol-3-phosphate acyltransferase n=1 Tax=Acidithiobacillus thiooxidans TaxID=930 RepID=UPI003564476E
MPLWPQQDQPAIITPNHASYLDGPLLALLTPRPLLFGVDPDFSTQEPWRSLLLRIGRIRGCEMV